MNSRNKHLSLMAKSGRLPDRLASRANEAEHSDWFEIKNAAGEKAIVRIYDEISYWGVSASEFASRLADITASEIEVQINSPGGDVFDGIAIYNALRTHPATITTRVDGLAASAASLIVQAGDHRVMMQSSQMMIHEAWGGFVGGADDMVEYAKVLDRINDAMADAYSVRSGADRDEILSLMEAETWMSADEAVQLGLADEVIDPSQKDQASSLGSFFNRIESSHKATFYQFTPQGAAMTKPTPDDVAPASKPDIKFMLDGKETTDILAVQRHIDALASANTTLKTENDELKAFQSDTVTAGRVAFVAALVADGKILAPQEQPMADLVCEMTDESFEAFSAIYAAAPKMAILTPQGAATTNPSGETNSTPESEEIEKLERIIENHRRAGMAEAAIASTNSAKRLAALKN